MGVQLKTSADIYPLWTAQVLSLLALLVQKVQNLTLRNDRLPLRSLLALLVQMRSLLALLVQKVQILTLRNGRLPSPGESASSINIRDNLLALLVQKYKY